MSTKMVNDQRVGFAEDSGYIDKKGVTAAQATNPDTRFNKLPPGQMIADQDTADIHDLPMKQVTADSYPGDGWT